MTNYNVQIKVSGIFDIFCNADSIESAIQMGDHFKWKDILAKNVRVSDGLHEVVGAWDNDCWDIILPATEGLVVKTKDEKAGITTLISMLGKTVMFWKQMK